jgi:hypothetical protein
LCNISKTDKLSILKHGLIKEGKMDFNKAFIDGIKILCDKAQYSQIELSKKNKNNKSPHD